MDSTPVAVTRFFRQDSKPTDAPDGARWLTESDGAGDDTASSYFYDAPSETWELDSAVGPSEPTAGTPVPGATWRDTANAVAKQYDGTEFLPLGVNDHADLSNVTDNQHHRALEQYTSGGGGGTVTVTGDGNQTVESGTGVVVGGSASQVGESNAISFTFEVRGPGTSWRDIEDAGFGLEWRVKARNSDSFERTSDYTYSRYTA